MFLNAVSATWGELPAESSRFRLERNSFAIAALNWPVVSAAFASISLLLIEIDQRHVGGQMQGIDRNRTLQMSDGSIDISSLQVGGRRVGLVGG